MAGYLKCMNEILYLIFGLVPMNPYCHILLSDLPIELLHIVIQALEHPQGLFSLAKGP